MLEDLKNEGEGGLVPLPTFLYLWKHSLPSPWGSMTLPTHLDYLWDLEHYPIQTKLPEWLLLKHKISETWEEFVEMSPI